MVMGELTQETEVLVIGSGPGGYAAAFRAADLGLEVTLVDPAPRPGGVCLFRGCIPSKTLLHVTELISDTRRSSAMGVSFGEPRIDLETLRRRKGEVIEQLAQGLESLSRRRGIQAVHSRARFEGPDRVRLLGGEGGHIRFRHAVVATGSTPVPFPGLHADGGGRVLDSSGALALHDIPGSLLVIGGGYVGMELGMVYAALGSRVTVVERGPRLMPGVDDDLLAPLRRSLEERLAGIHTGVQVAALEEGPAAVLVRFSPGSPLQDQPFDRVLVAIGRKPATAELGLQAAGVTTDPAGFITVDDRQRTTNPHILAVGDVVGGMMLAHKATREGKVAAEVIAGQPSAFDARAVPAVVYTDPQIAWCGITETAARAAGLEIDVHRFPWKFSGRALSMGAQEGMTKLIAEARTRRIIGMGIVGRHAEGLIAEGVLAVEMGATADDLALAIHAHPTLSETEGEAAELFLGHATHMMSASGRKG